LISEVGFIQVFAVFHDFVYGPLTRWFRRAVENTSVLMENVPGIQGFAGTIIVHARKPGASTAPVPALATHDVLRGKVSVVVPCHNEEMNVRPLVGALRAHYNDYLHEIILVDDNSRDRTRAVIEELAATDPRIKPVLRTPPPGVGRALRDGYAAATGEWILSMDCDFQHLLPEFEDLFDAAVGGADVVVGSRFSRMSVVLNYPWPKIVANRGFHLLMNLLLGIRFRDLTNNLKLMRRSVVESIGIESPGFSANAETGMVPVLQGRNVSEIPISWVNRTPGMGVSSFKLARVGGGYVNVLRRLWGKRKSLKKAKVAET
jgi:glycosyltransferase involved in cell wall biosynthesis